MFSVPENTMDNQQQIEAFKVDKDSSESSQPSFIQVLCKSSGKTTRFAPGTDAAFAVNLINKQLLVDNPPNNNSKTPLASHIEAVKPGEEPISFGPTATLINYGPSWILQTVPAKGEATTHKPKKAKGDEGYRSAKTTSQPLGLLYIGKILLALLIIFMIGATFTLFLESLPALLLYIHSNM